MRAKPCGSTDGIAVLAGAREAAGRADSVLPSDVMARFNELTGRGAVDAVAPTAAWAEVERAMAMPAPWRFVEVLRDCGALARLLPELDALFGVPQPMARHPEVDAGLHSLLTLRRAAERTADPAIRFAALLHDVGKAATPREDWPHHAEHARRGGRVAERIAARLRLPAAVRALVILAARHHAAAQRIDTLTPAQALQLFAAIGDRPRLEALALICEADHRGRLGYEHALLPQAALLRDAFVAQRS